jgi:hypothetical protein
MGAAADDKEADLRHALADAQKQLQASLAVQQAKAATLVSGELTDACLGDTLC